MAIRKAHLVRRSCVASLRPETATEGAVVAKEAGIEPVDADTALDALDSDTSSKYFDMSSSYDPADE